MYQSQHPSLPPRMAELLPVVSEVLRNVWLKDESPHFSQILMEVDEAEWQCRLSGITIRCDERLH